jgi:periplasmic protein TonB
MLTVLLESRAAHPRHVGGTLFSALAHGALIATIVAITLPDRGSARSAPDIHPTTVTFVRTSPAPATPSRTPAKSPTPTDVPTRPNLPTIDVPVITPTTIPPIDLSVPSTSSEQIPFGNRSKTFITGSSAVGGALTGAGGVSEASAVDRAPRIIGRALEPRYPATLRAAGIQGRVLAEFVVDTLGHAELTSLRFPELANPLFGDAVREALGQYRFTPGEVAGRRVRTRVAVPFEFRLER